jgi:adenosyl cobinamide kinase/adenosyl cobinamide phosphate guanylyltransferase
MDLSLVQYHRPKQQQQHQVVQQHSSQLTASKSVKWRSLVVLVTANLVWLSAAAVQADLNKRQGTAQQQHLQLQFLLTACQVQKGKVLWVMRQVSSMVLAAVRPAAAAVRAVSRAWA